MIVPAGLLNHRIGVANIHVQNGTQVALWNNDVVDCSQTRTAVKGADPLGPEAAVNDAEPALPQSFSELPVVHLLLVPRHKLAASAASGIGRRRVRISG